MDIAVKLHVFSVSTSGPRSTLDRMKIKTLTCMLVSDFDHPLTCPSLVMVKWQNLKYHVLQYHLVLYLFFLAISNLTATTYNLICAETKRQEVYGKRLNTCHLLFYSWTIRTNVKECKQQQYNTQHIIILWWWYYGARPVGENDGVGRFVTRDMKEVKPGETFFDT